MSYTSRLSESVHSLFTKSNFTVIVFHVLYWTFCYLIYIYVNTSISISCRTSCTKSLSFKEVTVFQADFWLRTVSVAVLDVTVLIICGDSIAKHITASRPFVDANQLLLNKYYLSVCRCRLYYFIKGDTHMNKLYRWKLNKLYRWKLKMLPRLSLSLSYVLHILSFCRTTSFLSKLLSYIRSAYKLFVMINRYGPN